MALTSAPGSVKVRPRTLALGIRPQAFPTLIDLGLGIISACTDIKVLGSTLIVSRASTEDLGTTLMDVRMVSRIPEHDLDERRLGF